MTSDKYWVLRHPEFRRRANREFKEYDRTDYEDIIAVTPYKKSEYPHERSYNTRKPAEGDEYIKYDHSITQNAFEGNVPDTVLDIIEIAVATFAADKAVGRENKIRENIDESQLQTRSIKLQIPVLSSRIATDEVEELYSEMVSHMTHDIVKYEFHKVESEITVEEKPDKSEREAISLLSDGLDSAAGVYYNKSQRTSSTYATVTYGHGAKSKAEDLAERAEIEHETYRVQYDGTGESTQFSRGLLHLSFGAAVASAIGVTEVRCFENGIMARFLILSQGWLTTRTVSPLFVAYLNEILDRILEQTVQVRNPFEDLTKTEILNEIPDTEIIHMTVSCPHTARFSSQNCGFCVPCLVRNVGILASNHEIPLDELSKYDPLTAADFEAQTLDFDVNEIKNPSANSPEIFFKGITEIAYFCRRILQETPRQLSNEYPELLDKEIYNQHQRFASNFITAMEKVKTQNQTVEHLLPKDDL